MRKDKKKQIVVIVQREINKIFEMYFFSKFINQKKENNKGKKRIFVNNNHKLW